MTYKEMLDHVMAQADGRFDRLEQGQAELRQMLEARHKDIYARLNAVERDQAVANVRHGILATLTAIISSALTAVGFKLFGGHTP